MPEYIDRKVLLKEIEGAFPSLSLLQQPNVAAIRDYVKMMPAADVVEVVRCKKCKYIRPVVNEYTHDVTGLWCSLFDIENVAENHFCSYGERRADYENL